MSSNGKSTRDRAPKCSIVLSNVLAVVFRPTSTAVQLNNLHHDENCENKDTKLPHQLNGLELFDAFKEANRSTVLTRLTESLDEIRLKGWVFPFTLLIKGPHEDVEVIKEAWKRHFLRSPDNFIIKDIGKFNNSLKPDCFLPFSITIAQDKKIFCIGQSALEGSTLSVQGNLSKKASVLIPKSNLPVITSGTTPWFCGGQYI